MQPREIVDHIAAFVGVLDPDGTLIDINQTALTVAGVSRDDVVGRKVWDCPFFIYDPNVADTIKNAVERSAQGEALRFDIAAATAPGEIVTVDLMIYPVRDDLGRIRYLIPSGVDVTERKRVEDELRRSLYLLERAQRIGQFGHWAYNLETEELDVSDEARRIFFGDERLEISAEQVQRRIHPDDIEHVWAGMRDAVNKRQRFATSYRLRRDGEERILEVEADVDCDQTGKPLRLFGIVRDVTEARRRDRQLTEQQRFIDVSQLPIFYWDIDRGLLHWSTGCEQLYGFSREEALGRMPYELLKSEFPIPYAEIRQQLESGAWWGGEVIQTTRDGRKVIVEVRLDLFTSDGRRLVMEDNRDVTAQREAEERLKLSEERLAHAAALTGLGTFDHDETTGALHLSNRPWGEELPEETTLENLLNIIHPEDRETVRGAIAKSLDPAGTGELDLEYRIIRRSGEVRWMSVRSRTIFEGEGSKRHPVRRVGAVLDITERRTWDEHQRLLMGELNHRVRNTLSVVQAIATQTLRSTRDPKTFTEDFTGRIQAIASAHKLLNEATWKGTHLTDLIREQLSSVGGAGQIATDGPEVWLPPQVALNLGLVLHELGTNARKYGALSRPSGRVQITWTVRKADDKPVLHLIWRETGGPPVRPPQAPGFGMGLIERIIGGTVEGETSVRFEPEGLHCVIEMALQPITRIEPPT